MTPTQAAVLRHRADAFLAERDARPWSESLHQQTVVSWCHMLEPLHPELRWLYAVPNGGFLLGKAAAGRLKGEGLKTGVFDLGLDIARGGYHGLKIEMKVPASIDKTGKKTRPGTPSEEQLEWYQHYCNQGYRAEICHGFRPAIALIREYLGL